MKRYFFIIIAALLGCVQLSQAQQKLSLADAVEYATKNRYDVQANQLDITLAENAVNKSRNEWIPELTASGEVLYNSQLQTMIFDNGEEFKMGTKNLTTLSLNLSQPIFKPGLNTGIKISKAALSVQKEALREKGNNIKIYVVEAYLNVILREEQLSLSKDNTERDKSYFELAHDKMQLGTILESELIQAQTDYENSLINLQKAEQNHALAMKGLKYHLNMPDSEEVILTDSLSTLLNSNPILMWQTNIEDRPELKQLYYSQEENDLRLKKSSMMWLPTLSLVANYTTEYQADNFRFSRKYWFPYNYVGLKAGFPLSNILKRHTDRWEYHAKSSQLVMQYNQKLHDIHYEREKYYTELTNASWNINSTNKNLDLSRALYSQQLAVYRLGTINYSVLLDTESSVNTAEQNYITAIYEYLIAYVNYTKALGFN
jgi:outer membrane protein TolC